MLQYVPRVMCRGSKILRYKKGTFVRIFSPLVYFIKSDPMVPRILILHYFQKKIRIR
jgi:hypothetical protein